MLEGIISLVILPAAIAALVATLATFFTIKLAPLLGVIDDPKKRPHPATLHTLPTPRGGGIPVFLGILTSALIFLTIDRRLGSILLGGALLVLTGLWDDRKSINPYLRLLGQFLAAGVVVTSGIGIAFATNPLGGILDFSKPQLIFEFWGETRTLWVLSVSFGLLWMVALMNAVSWSSGVDGQLSGVAAIAALVIAIISLRFLGDSTQWPVTILAAATFGAYLGFLPWHIYPQKIMPGFGGATLAGFMLAVLAILATAKVGTLLVVLAIPIVDGGYTILRRIAQGRSPVWGDKEHLHHKLLRLGWSKQKVASFYWLATAILGILALNLSAPAKLYTMVTILLVLGGVLLWLSSLFQPSRQPGQISG